MFKEKSNNFLLIKKICFHIQTILSIYRYWAQSHNSIVLTELDVETSAKKFYKIEPDHLA